MHRLQDPRRDPRAPDGVAPLAGSGHGRISRASFTPAWWCRGPHLQTLWPSLFRFQPRPSYRRERLTLGDGDFLDLDWFGPLETDRLVIVLHGLEGSSASHYVRALAQGLAARGVGGVVMHQRGCGGEPNRLARFYHAGETGDFERVLEHCLARAPGAALYATGFSLGGNILLKWLGETGDASTLRGAVAVSVPFRLDVGARRLERGLSRLYQRHLVGSMKRSVERKRQRMAYPVDADALAACRTFAQIDTCLTAPLHGFRDAWDYYARSSSRQFLPGIRTPSLVLHACDDPFLTPEAVPGANELPPDVTLELSEHGGHCGFVAGSLPLRPRYWLDHRIPAQILGPAAASD